jgi:antitoxin MazE
MDNGLFRIYIAASISGGRVMQVARWGNSLAVRLPASVVEALGLKEGDAIEIRVAGERAFDVALDRSRERALERVRALRKPLPPGWRFDRDEANAR